MTISEDNCETTVTDNSAYSPGVSIFTTDQLQYDVTIRNFEGTVKSVAAERLSLGSISAITDAMAVDTKKSHMKKTLPWPKWEKFYLPLLALQIIILEDRWNHTL